MEGFRISKFLRAFFTIHWGGFFLTTALLHLIVGSYFASYMVLPEKFGVHTEGTVLEKRADRFMRRGVVYTIVYSFKDSQGNTIRDERMVAREFFERVNKGDTIRTSYLKLFPSFNTIEGVLGGVKVLVLFYAGVVLTILALLVLGVELRKIRDSEPDNLFLRLERKKHSQGQSPS